jgi:hypothetical protein
MNVDGHQMFAASILAAVTSACERSGPPSIGNAGSSAMVQAPEIVERAWPEADRNAGMECAAAPPTDGILDRTSAAFRRIEVRRGELRIEERAFYRSGPIIEVTASTGGCAHAGTAYRFVMASSRPINDRRYYLRRALDQLAVLPVRQGALDLRGEILDALSSLPAGDDCIASPNEIVTVSCQVTADPAGVAVELAYDVAL